VRDEFGARLADQAGERGQPPVGSCRLEQYPADGARARPGAAHHFGRPAGLGEPLAGDRLPRRTAQVEQQVVGAARPGAPE